MKISNLDKMSDLGRERKERNRKTGKRNQENDDNENHKEVIEAAHDNRVDFLVEFLGQDKKKSLRFPCIDANTRGSGFRSFCRENGAVPFVPSSQSHYREEPRFRLHSLADCSIQDKAAGDLWLRRSATDWKV